MSSIPEYAEVARLYGPRALQFDTEALVDPSRADGVVARTLWSAISPGTELAAYRGLPPLRPGPVYPRLVGYCNVAEVLRVGGGVTRVRVGDRIVTWQSHRSAFSVPEADVLVVLGAGADPRAATATYLFHLGYDAVLKSRIRHGHEVAVVGLGALGLAGVAMSARAGANVTAITRRSEMFDLARRIGASNAAHGADVDGLVAGTGIGGFDVVITTSNSWDDWRLALRLARRGGMLAVLGFPGRGEAAPDFNPLSSQYFYDKQLTLTACGQTVERDAPPDEVRFTLKRNMAMIASEIARGRLSADAFLGLEFDARRLDEAYRSFDTRGATAATAVLKWT